MRRIAAVAACLSVLMLLVSAPIAGAQSKLEGVWKVAEVTLDGPNGHRAISNPQPSLWIFTKKHYSITAIQLGLDQPRPELPQKATDAQKAATWGPTVGDAGAYEIKGATVMLYPAVSKDPQGMAPGTSHPTDFKIEGNTLWITANYGNAVVRTKFDRIE